MEAELPGWGEKLYASAVGHEKSQQVFAAWQHADPAAERRFSIRVDDEPPLGVAKEEAAEAAAELLGLPWELLHDGSGWLFQGGAPVRVRRRLPNRKIQPVQQAELPVRILLLSPRPVADGGGNPIGYIDHRASALPLVEAVEGLGELVRLTVLHPPTYAALEQALEKGDDGHPFDVVHFDGHGVYDHRTGLGGLCFEQPTDGGSWQLRTLDFVDATRLAGLARAYRIPLVFLARVSRLA